MQYKIIKSVYNGTEMFKVKFKCWFFWKSLSLPSGLPWDEIESVWMSEEDAMTAINKHQTNKFRAKQASIKYLTI